MSEAIAAPRVGKSAETAVDDTKSLLNSILDRVDAIGEARPQQARLMTWDEIERFAEKAARTDMVPRAYKGKPDDIAIAVQMGQEIGLAPMQALQNIASINGRPAVWGDAIPGLIRRSGKCAWMKEWSEGEGENLIFHFETRRKDDPNPIRASFSVADATKAGLWQTEPRVRRRGKDGGWYEAENDSPWYRYPRRMLQMRARGFGARDAYPDVLRGLISVEEAIDVPEQSEDRTSIVRTEAIRESQTAISDAPSGLAPSKRRTWAELLDQIERDFAACGTREEVDLVLASEEVQKAMDNARNGARDRLTAIVQTAMQRTDDGWPGDKPEGWGAPQEAA